MTPAKFLRTAFGIRGLTSAYISRVFLRTEMALKSRSVLTGSRSLARSRSTDNLPTSQSQVNIQMMSHTLTIREVCASLVSFLFMDFNWIAFIWIYWRYPANLIGVSIDWNLLFCRCVYMAFCPSWLFEIFLSVLKTWKISKEYCNWYIISNLYLSSFQDQ